MRARPIYSIWMTIDGAPRMLVVDDDASVRDFVARTLQTAGYDVVGLDSDLFEGCDFGKTPVAISGPSAALVTA